MKALVLILLSWSVYGSSDENFIASVNKKLKKNPDNIYIIAEAGKYFYRKGNCKKAIWYWSSPKLKSHKGYQIYKYFQLKCHLKLKEYAKAEYVIILLRKENLSTSLRKRVTKLATLIRRKVEPPAPPAKIGVSLYYASLNYAAEAEKNEASLIGGSLNISKKQAVFDFAYENLTIGFNPDLGIENYEQVDYVLGFGYYNESYEHYNNVVFHTNSASSELALESSSLLYGYKFFFAPLQNLGFELGYSSFASGQNESSFTSIQLSPSLTKSLTDSIYFTVKTNISFNNYESSVVSEEDTKGYTSFEGSLGYYGRIFQLELGHGSGDERFLFKQGGFLVQNATDTSRSSSHIMMKLILSKELALSGKYQSAIYSEENSTEEYNSNTMLVFGTLNF